MTMIDAPVLVTPDDLLRMPDAGVLELIDGHVVERAMSKESSRIAGRVLARLAIECERNGEAEAYPNDLGYRCFNENPGMVRRGDVSLVRQERLAGIETDPGYMPIPADLIVEVVSPTDLSYGVSEKVALYLANGFPQVWVVDPVLRTVTVYRPDATPVVFRASDEITAAPALASFRCRVADFFGR